MTAVHFPPSTAPRQFESLRHGVRSIRINKQLGRLTDRLTRNVNTPRIVGWMGADLHLHHGKAPLCPAPKLPRQLGIVTGGETAAAV
jgi:hypothetical protein